MRGQVLVTWIDYDADGERTGARLRAAGLQVRHVPKRGARTPRELAALLDGAVAAIVSTDPFDDSVFAAAPALRVVARVGVGSDSIDLRAASRAGVAVTVTRGANAETAADHTLALMLAALRRVLEHDGAVRVGAWSRGGPLTPWDLHGATVGLVGYGDIGRAVARRLAGFEVTLLVADPAFAGDGAAERVDLGELARRSDVVSLHLPLTRATRRILGERELALMRPGTVVVNTSRGGLIDEAALAARLRDGRLRAAALDVFEGEPAVPRALTGLSNVVLTPHIGGLSVASIAAMTEQATSHVLDVLAGRPDAAALANPEVLGARRRANGSTVLMRRGPGDAA
jgi:phosphoglycerate dehydrogenase-like enzyme